MTWLTKLLLHLIALLPLRAIHGLGAVLGWGFVLIPNKRRATTATNLALCLPEWSPAQRRQLLRKNLLETTKGVLETGALWMWSKKKILDKVIGISGGEVLQAAFDEGKGVILAAPHMGTWEIFGLYCPQHYPMTILYKPPPMAAMEGIMRAARERFGAKLSPTDARGIRSLYRALDNGELVGILPDQDPAAGAGVFAPFFGVPANTMVLLSRLAAKTGAAVLCVYAERLSKGRGYHLHFLRAPATINDPDLQRSTTELNRMVERCVRALPEQYLWAYKRFRTRPPGEARIYHR